MCLRVCVCFIRRVNTCVFAYAYACPCISESVHCISCFGTPAAFFLPTTFLIQSTCQAQPPYLPFACALLHARTHTHTHTHTHTCMQVGTPYYVSPEVVRGAGYDWKSDVWSLGCLLYELACLRSPFEVRYD